MSERDRSDRLLSALIAALIGLALLSGLILTPLIPEFRTTLEGIIPATAVLVPAFFLARAGRQRLAVWLALVVILVAPLAIKWANPDDPVTLGMLAIATLIASIFLRTREVAAVAVLQVAGILLLPILRPGAYRAFEISGFSLFMVCVAGMSIITARHRAAQDAERAAMERQLFFRDRLASIGVLTAGITHEVRNSLTSVVLSLDALARLSEGSATDPELLQLVKGAQESARHIKDIVSDLQAFGRPDGSAPAAIRLMPVVESSLRISRHALVQRARVTVDIPAETQVQGSEGRLAQVLLNLLINAAQAIPEGNPSGNEIRISARSSGPRTIVEVRDTGAGIAPEIRDRIFEPFFTTKRDGEGTGLGLWIARNLVMGMGGEVRVESEPGRGTTFQLLLNAPSA
ncbi:MAG TPA: ATP-binding protein [bacterium]|nr:ATP-binding protein [bacterium]